MTGSRHGALGKTATVIRLYRETPTLRAEIPPQGHKASKWQNPDSNAPAIVLDRLRRLSINKDQ